jgi:hypothetical protein
VLRRGTLNDAGGVRDGDYKRMLVLPHSDEPRQRKTELVRRDMELVVRPRDYSFQRLNPSPAPNQ